jgi:hypothetical protein
VDDVKKAEASWWLLRRAAETALEFCQGEGAGASARRWDAVASASIIGSLLSLSAAPVRLGGFSCGLQCNLLDSVRHRQQADPASSGQSHSAPRGQRQRPAIRGWPAMTPPSFIGGNMRPHAANRRRRASKAALESSDALLPANTVYPSVVEGKLLALELRQCKPEKCSLELPEGLSEADWIGVGNTLGSIDTGLSWWIGDWWQFAEARYSGKRKAIVEAAEWNGPAYQTCVNAANVARRFRSNRRESEDDATLK